MSGSNPSSTATSETSPTPRIFDIAIQMGVGLIFLIASYRILSPFVPLILWGGVIAVAIYPLFVRLGRRFGERRKTVAALFVVIALGIIIVPVMAISSSVFDVVHVVGEDLEQGTLKVPPPPPKVKEWPVVGEKASSVWMQASINLQAFTDKYAEQMKSLAHYFVSLAASLGADALQIIFSVAIAAIFLVNGDSAARGMEALSSRIFGRARGKEFITLAAKTVRSVATGVLGVAFIQAVLAGAGMALAGVPFAGAWALAVLLLAIMQLPPIIVLLPVAIWVFGQEGSPFVAWGFLVWSILVSFSDGVLKPLLLGRGVEVPMVVILLGAIGGMVARGIVGLFIGAVVLSLAYQLLIEWLDNDSEAPQEKSEAESTAS